MAAEPEREPEAELDKRIAKSVGHPLRIGIMRILSERTASPSELAESLGEGVSQVSYHVSELFKYGCVELVDTEPSRGAIEHFYRATSIFGIDPWFVDDDQSREMTAQDRASLAATVLQRVMGEALPALSAGTMKARPDFHMTWQLPELDQQGWEEVAGILTHALAQIQLVESEAADRLDESGEEGIPAFVGMLCFERCPEP